MKMRAGFLVTCAASALAIGLGFASPARAADTMPTKAPAIVAPIWWYDGFAEIGYRGYLNDPDRRKLGRFFRYEDWSPGVFGDFFAGAHRTGPDPLDIEAWGKNIGWNNQAFGLDIYKPGTYYLTFGWDETPHNYAFDAKTTFSGIGGNTLISPVIPTGSLAAAQAAVNANTNIFDLGIRRDTASAAARWTPNDSWDITADYTHMHRQGTQQLSTENTTTIPGATRTSIQIPKPVDDTTQNGSVKAEYTGSSPWGKPFNVALGYGLSIYDDQVGCGTVPGTTAPTAGTNCVTYNNPWVTANSGAASMWNRYTLPPDNQAHSLSASGGVGLPLNSRYMGTFQYTWMTQDEPFQSSTINPALAAAILPRSSLGGDARTILANNVLNTQITSDLTSTLRYKYYDYHSYTPLMRIAGVFNRPDSNSSAAVIVDGVPVSFNKQNASDELVYRPWKWLDVGAAYEWERWQHSYTEPDDTAGLLPQQFFSAVTKENAGRAFFDAKWGWSTLRTSVRYSQRRLDGPYVNVTDANASFRTIDLQDRNSTIVKSSWDINVTNTVTFTPTGGYRRDDYPADGLITNGISLNESWNAGGDIAWTPSPMLSLYVSYTHEDGIRDVYTNPTGTVARTNLRTRDLNDVIIVGGKYTVIPDKLFLNANYTYSRGLSRWDQDCGPTGVCNPTPVPAYPDTHNTNQRIDASAKYVFDESVTRGWGLWPKTQAYVKARAVWESNSNDSWQNIEQQLGWALPGADATLMKAIFLGMSNPNYNVIVGMLSFGVKW
jgi:MtrB/PioB family decaheme-associated outer membrane protein